MEDKNQKKLPQVKSEELVRLDGLIKSRYPDLPTVRVRDMRERLLSYVVDGLEQDFEVGLIKQTDNEEITIRVLRILDQEVGANQQFLPGR